MYDNGLLQYYKTLGSKDGILDARSLDASENLIVKKGKVKRCSINGGSYYLKSALRAHKPDRHYYDAEILLSQIFNKAGIPSAVYLPATFSDGEFLVSNDVEKDDVVLASRYLGTSLKVEKTKTIPFLASSEEIMVKPTKYYTKNAMRQQTRMRILDTASCNYDRHKNNFFYSLRSSLEATPQQEEERSVGSEIVDYFRSLIPNKAKDVVAIDFGISGSIIEMLKYGSQYVSLFDLYSNDFGRKPLQRDEMIEKIEESEALATLIDKNDFAETIGSLDPIGVAQDIKETIGYTVDNNFTSFLAKAYDDMAETLLQ